MAQLGDGSSQIPQPRPTGQPLPSEASPTLQEVATHQPRLEPIGLSGTSQLHGLASQLQSPLTVSQVPSRPGTGSSQQAGGLHVSHAVPQFGLSEMQPPTQVTARDGDNPLHTSVNPEPSRASSVQASISADANRLTTQPPPSADGNAFEGFDEAFEDFGDDAMKWGNTPVVVNVPLLMQNEDMGMAKPKPAARQPSLVEMFQVPA